MLGEVGVIFRGWIVGSRMGMRVIVVRRMRVVSGLVGMVLLMVGVSRIGVLGMIVIVL